MIIYPILRLLKFPFLVFTGVLLASCGSYRQNILFQVSPEEVSLKREEAERNYLIQPNDLLGVDVFTNKGEKLIDPNRQAFEDANSRPSTPSERLYLVDAEGAAKLPLIGDVKLAGLTLRQAEDNLEKEYERFYEETYVVLTFQNKRVVVLGAPGGQVIPLANENMRLTEVLALAKGITPDGRANNIRVIRENEVLVADLSTFDGYQKGNMIMKAGDIVYVEPISRPFIEALRDYSPVITIVSSLATLIFIISQVK